MSYIGSTPVTQTFISGTDYFNGTGSQTAFTLSRTVNSVNDIEVVINNVVQQPNSAYNISGNTITFTSAPSSGTANIYVRYLTTTSQTMALGPNTVTQGPQYISINGATALGGATNPILGTSGSANNYVQTYVQNLTNGANSSADFTAYPSNGADAAGWVDMGMTGPSFSQAAYSVTGPNEPYLFGSGVSGSGTGNLVIATDATGSTNAIQFYTGGFNQAKGAYTAQLNSTGLVMGTNKGITFANSSAVNSATLNDYETGTWTPILTFGGVANGMTYGSRTGGYTKIGNLVFFTFDIVLTAKGTSTGSAYVLGLPFPYKGSVQGNVYPASMLLGSATSQLILNAGVFNSNVYIYYNYSAGYSNLSDTAFTNTSELTVGGCYLTTF